MFKHIKSVIPVIAILLVIYIAINLIHLSWAIVMPEGFWSFFYFIGVLVGLVTVLIVLLYIIVGLGASIFKLFAEFPESLSRRSLTKFALYMIGVPLILLFNFFWANGFSLYLNSKMSDKYSYINRSEKHLREGNVEKALTLAEKAYEKESGNKGSHPIFIATYLYERSDFHVNNKFAAEYGALINYAYCLEAGNDALKAEGFYLKALELSLSAPPGEEHNSKVFPILSLAQLNLNQGRYAEGDRYFNELLILTDHFRSEDIEYVCLTQDIFSAYAQHVGDYKKAARLNISNLELYEKSELSKKSSAYLMRLLMASFSHMQLGDMISAGKLIAKAQPIAERKKEKEVYLIFLSQKAAYCNMAAISGYGFEEVLDKGWWGHILNVFSKKESLSKRYIAEAESCLKKLVEESEDRYGENDPAYSRNLSSLASFYWSQGKLSDAQELYKRSLKAFEPYKGQHLGHYYTILLHSQLADMHSKKAGEASNIFSEVEDFYFQKLAANYMFLTEEERETYIMNMERNVGAINAAYAAMGSPQAKMRLYDNILATKSVALYANRNIRQAVSGSADSLKNKYSLLLKEKEAYQTIRSYSSVDQDRLENEIKLKEKAIVAEITKAPTFRAFDPRSVRWSDIRASLKAGEAAVEFINVSDVPFSKSASHYFALLIKKNSESPELIPLFKEEEIAKVLNKGGSLKERTDSIYFNEIGQLRNLIWKPLENRLDSPKRIFISLSGLLHKISFPALLSDAVYEFEILPSTRQIVSRHEQQQQFNAIALYGDIDYDFNSKSDNGVDENRLTPNHASLITERGRVGRLKYTREEIENIRGMIEENQGVRAEVFSDTSATKSSFMNLGSSGFDIVHLATHGFYFSSKNLARASNISLNLGEASGMSDNPLSRCVLLFAGANMQQGSSIGSGVLTAMEISRLDLSNIDLVVLSACETGLGDIQGSEGVKGFNRAFAMAGVNSVMISLWKVSDKHTSELMGLFYKELLTGKSKSAALALAQAEMRRRYDSPYYWAGFMLVEG